MQLSRLDGRGSSSHGAGRAVSPVHRAVVMQPPGGPGTVCAPRTGCRGCTTAREYATVLGLKSKAISRHMIGRRKSLSVRVRVP